MEEKKKRKGYKTIEQQMAATKRYLENNPKAKELQKKSVAKSQAKKYINEYATIEELKEIEQLIEERKKSFKK